MEEIIQEDVNYDGEALCSMSEEEQKIEEMLKMLTKLEIDSAYTCEKLLNLHVLLMHLLAWDNDLEGMGGTLDSSEASFEKALTFDLLCGVLESELKQVDEVLDELEAQIVDTSYQLSTCKNANYIVMEGKLGETAESLKQSRGQVSDITLQLAQLRRTLHYIRNGTSNHLFHMLFLLIFVV